MIYAPDHRIVIILREIGGGKKQGNERRIGPVEEPCRQAMLRGESEPVPNRISCRGIGMSILAKVAKQVTFQLRYIGPSRHTHQACSQVVSGVRHTAVYER